MTKKANTITEKKHQRASHIMDLVKRNLKRAYGPPSHGVSSTKKVGLGGQGGEPIR